MLPPKGILGKDPETAGEATIKALPRPFSILNFFIVGPNTASDANPVPKASVPIHNAVFESPRKFEI